MSLSKSLSKSSKRDNFEYDTPEELARDLLSLIDFEPNDLVLDPCAGNRVWYNNLPTENKDWCEINDGLDFFDYNDNPDVIVGNPPFDVKRLKPFLEHALRLSKRLIAFIMPSHTLTNSINQSIRYAGFYIEQIHGFKCWFGYPCFFVIMRRGINPSRTLPKFVYKSPYQKITITKKD